jgi:hypothetical protein
MKVIISSVIALGALTPLAGAHAARTTPADSRPPLVLDSETGVHGGNGGAVLESAPLPGEARGRRAVAPWGETSSGTTYLVEPTIVFGAGSAGYVQPRTRPLAQPGSQPAPRPAPEPDPQRDPESGRTHRPHPDVPANGTQGDVPSPGSPGDLQIPRPRRELGSGAPTLPKLPKVPTPGTN